MNRAALSIFLFGLYVVALGIALAAQPNFVIAPFGFEEAKEPWIRVMGVVVVTLGAYYVEAARRDARPFFEWTVYGRFIILLGFIGLVVIDLAPPPLIIFGVIDATGALWTAYALKTTPAEEP